MLGTYIMCPSNISNNTGQLLKESDKETGHQKTVTSLLKSSDGSHFLIGSLDKSAKLWDSRTVTLIKTYVTERAVNTCAISPLLGHVVLGGGQDASHVTTTDRSEAKFYHKGLKNVFLFVEQILQEEIGGVKGHFGPINALAFNPDGRRFSCLLGLNNRIAYAYARA
ncbi:putative Eukaryotic translation initiation factor 3 subunit I [Cocos nucifera]|uniref:Serine-threonine kinase receptor-associated protein n=1 Tax=Cocos nucifera TaxID=13894 RepID=A0A8K0N238_COCNU|nr:putative Eukaryotic translation initiation factor 3 subunit I [Cocos nucifera]